MESYFNKQIEEANKIDPNYKRLWDNIKNVTMAGGKRLRPYLVFTGYGKIDDNVLPVAAAQELLHAALLMHDDIIDKDNIRHGTNNLNGLYDNIYSSVENTDQRMHFAYSAAILAGDLLISEAHKLIAQSDFDAVKKLQASSLLSTSIFEVAGGELLDVEASFTNDDNYDPLVVYRYKTAGYSFVGPLTTGGLLGGHSDQDIEKLRQYAINLGIAYQLHDDYLGVFGNEDETGKSSSCDLYEGKKTYLLGKFLETASPEAIKLYKAVTNGSKNDSTLDELKAAIINSGAVDANTNLERDFVKKSAESIDDLADLTQKQALLHLIEKLTSRKS